MTYSVMAGNASSAQASFEHSMRQAMRKPPPVGTVAIEQAKPPRQWRVSKLMTAAVLSLSIVLFSGLLIEIAPNPVEKAITSVTDEISEATGFEVTFHDSEAAAIGWSWLNPLQRCLDIAKKGAVWTWSGTVMKRSAILGAAVCAGNLGYGVGSWVANQSWYQRNMNNRLNRCWPNCSNWDFTRMVLGF